MRTLRDGVCLLVAVGSIALAAWQPAVGTDRADDARTTTRSGVAQQVGVRQPQTVERAILSAPLPRT